jgi:hypothetical protein
MRMNDLQAGWNVVGNDGRHVGTVREVGQHFLRVSTGAFGDDIYVPASAIGNVEGEVVHLNLTAREAASSGWGQRPRDEDLPEGPESDLHRHV